MYTSLGHMIRCTFTNHTFEVGAYFFSTINLSSYFSKMLKTWHPEND